MSLAILPFLRPASLPESFEGRTRVDSQSKPKGKRKIEEKDWKVLAEEPLASTSTTSFQLIILDHLLVTREIEAAKTFIEEVGGFGSLVIDWPAHELRRDIILALKDRKLDTVIGILESHYAEILSDPLLHFSLLLLQFDCIVASGQLEQALDYASNVLAERAGSDPRMLRKMEDHMILLLSIDPTNPQAQRTASQAVLEFEERSGAFVRCRDDLNSALLKFHSLSDQSHLQLMYNGLLWTESRLQSILDFSPFFEQTFKKEKEVEEIDL